MNIKDISDTAQKKAQDFLKIAHDFQLGNLPTEQRHPETFELALLSRTNIQEALSVLKKIDLDVIAKVKTYAPALQKLEQAIATTLAEGHKVFFYGCGATGRLSLSIEYIWRFLHQDQPEMANRILGFMSGGDLALVHSIENFEDHPEYGARQLQDIGFGAHDLLVSCTEGGETPSVIGATEEATRLSTRKPFFLYCNPDHVLHEQVERSRHVLDNPLIEKICLYVGPMSLSGSTRLQASTVLMLAAGNALIKAGTHESRDLISELEAFLKQTDLSFLEAFIVEESGIYSQNDFVMYETNAYGMTVLTDTTERAPTFSLLSFENQNDEKRKPSLSYLYFPKADSALEAWRAILLRDPIPIEWDVLKAIAGYDRMLGFDFSKHALMQRKTLCAPHTLHDFKILREGDDLTLSLNHVHHKIDVKKLHPLCEHLFLKIILNMHSTLLMGRLNRFESNIMTWVKPSNKKLIDRAIRYVEYLLHHEQIYDFSYADICHQLFACAEHMTPSQSVVLLTCTELKNKKALTL